MLGTRLVTGFAMAGVTIAIFWLDGHFAPWFPLWLMVTLLGGGAAAVELVGLFAATTIRPSRGTVVGGVTAMVLSNWAPHVVGEFHRLPHTAGRVGYDPLGPVNALAWPFLSFTAVVMFAFVAQSLRFKKPGGNLATIAGTILAVAYVGLLGSFAIQMRWLDGPYRGLFPLLFLFVTAKMGDIGAYTLGRLAGRHKLWPLLSPNKTIEGAFGGLIFSVLGALVIASIARFGLRIHTMSLGKLIAFGLLVGASAQLGDLMESMIKRDCERKDASTAVPGFGGVLDVIDSVLFSGPVAYGFWLWAGA